MQSFFVRDEIEGVSPTPIEIWQPVCRGNVEFHRTMPEFGFISLKG
jgi:hypothetical protein